MIQQQNTEADDKNLSLEDIVHWQDSLKKDVDFSKPDSELTPEEMVKKQMCLTIDKMVEEKVGKDVKNNIDTARKQMAELSAMQINLDKIFELGREIEKNFIWQGAYIINHFNKSEENHFYTLVNNMTSVVVSAKNNMPNIKRVEESNKILNIVQAYRDKVVKELNAKQEIVSALLPAFEQILNNINFDLIEGTDSIKSKYQEWLVLSKQLVDCRKKAIEAVSEDLDIEEILPKIIIKNEGDITQNISLFELKAKGERVIKLTKEASSAEEEMEVKRSALSVDLFGKVEEYMDVAKSTEEKPVEVKQNPLSHLESRMWFRFVKIIYIGLWVFGLGISAIIASDGEGFGAFVWGAIIVWVILTVIKKAFLYVVLGKNQ